MTPEQTEKLIHDMCAIRERVRELAGTCLLDRWRVDVLEDPSPSQIGHSRTCNFARKNLKKADAFLYYAGEALMEAVRYRKQGELRGEGLGDAPQLTDISAPYKFYQGLPALHHLIQEVEQEEFDPL